MERLWLLDIGEILSGADHRLAFGVCIYRAAGGPRATKARGRLLLGQRREATGSRLQPWLLDSPLGQNRRKIQQLAAKPRRLVRYCQYASGPGSRHHGSGPALASVSHGAAK